MPDLQNLKVETNYPKLLNVASTITASLQSVDDGSGNTSALQVSTSSVKSTGTLEATGNMTSGGQITGGSYSGDGTGLNYGVRDISASGSIESTDRYITVSVASLTIELPPASSLSGRELTFKNKAGITNTTIDGSGVEKIDTDVAYILSAEYNSVTIWSDGTQWWVKSAF